ncbi:MAG: hypothetical protein IPP72_17065 [Chitinophagaceae bacterium]|nr:hypothetical protein [Chitinophagaceae bacterium]
MTGDVIPADKWEEQNTGYTLPVLDELLYNAKVTHPKLKLYNYKLQIQEVERKLKFQDLLPTINVKANLLNKGYDLLNGIGKAGFYDNNNKFGIDIGFAIAAERGAGRI